MIYKFRCVSVVISNCYLESRRPQFSHCPNDTTVPTESGKGYAEVNWTVPTAKDKDGQPLEVVIWPPGFAPPVKLDVGEHYLDVSASDKDGEYAYCYFFITVEGKAVIILSYVFIA